MKFIKENFDRSADLERRITDYKLKHLNESIEKPEKEIIEEEKKVKLFEIKYEQAGTTKIDSNIEAEDIPDAMKKFASKHLKDVEPVKKIISCDSVEYVLDEDVKQDLKVSEDKAKVQLQGLVDQAKKVLGEVGDGLKSDIAAVGFTLDNSGKVVKVVNESTYDPIDKNEVKKVDNYYKQHYPEEYEDATTEVLWSAVHTGNDQENVYFNSEAKLKDYIKRNKETLSTAVKGKYKIIILNGGKSSEDHIYIPLETPEVVWDNPAYDNKPVSKINEEVKKLPNGKWANVGEDGKADSGEFDTKKEARQQQKAMFANGYKGESLEKKTEECLTEDVEIEIETKDEPKVEVEDSDEHSIKNVPEMPTTDCKMVVANILNPLIKDELEAIDGYNSAVATFRGMLEDGTTDKSIDYNGIIAVISEITNEENLHIGQLEKLLETVSPNAKSINDGKEEAAEQLEETSEEEVEKEVEKEETIEQVEEKEDKE